MATSRRYDIAVAQAVAIVLIVQDHIAGTDLLGPMRILLPFESARVLFFVFIAGYFNAAKSTTAPVSFARDKVRKLFLPLYGLTLLYAAIVTALHLVGLPQGEVSLYSVLLDPLLGGHDLYYNLPMWFIAPLFFAEVAYAFLGRIARGRGHVLEYCLIALSVGIVVWKGSADVTPGVPCLVLRTAHFLGWYALGRVYREKLEGILAKLPIRYGILAYAAVFLAADALSGGNCALTIAWLRFPGGLLSAVVALDGLFGLMLLGRALESIAKGSRLVDLLSQNTFAIMCHHVLGITLLTGAVALASKATPWFNTFDLQAYLTTFGYVWLPANLTEFTWLYTALAILFAIAFQHLLDGGVSKATCLPGRGALALK